MVLKAESSAIKNFIKSLKSVTNYKSEDVPLHEPEFSDLEVGYVRDCIKSGWVSSAGEFVGEFEKKLCRTLNCEYAIAMSSGTSALQVALICCGIKSNDEVLVPALTFVATANAVAHVRATPHFIDSNFETLGVCPDLLREHLEATTYMSGGQTINKQSGNVISAIIPMHAFGHPVDIDPVMAVAEEFNLKVVEDAAEALGSKYKNRFCGTFGEVGMLSFNGNKIITTGGGGALVTNSQAIAKHARHLSTTAKLDHRFKYQHDEVAFNFRMPNLNAALGCAQIDKLDDFLARKRTLFEIYEEEFKNSELVDLFKEPTNASSNHWLNSVLIKKEYASYCDFILQAACESGIQCRPAWTLMSELPMFEDCPKASLKNAEEITSRLINIPSSPGLVK